MVEGGLLSVSMRTRSRTTSPLYQEIEFFTIDYPNGEWYDQSTIRPGVYDYGNNDGGSEYMEDDPNPSYGGEKDVLQIRDLVQHRPLQRLKLGYMRYNSYVPYRENLYDTSMWHAYLLRMMPTFVSYHQPSSDMLPTLDDIEPEVTWRAYQSVLPKVNDGLSLVNFVLELKDLRRMFDFKTVERLLNTLTPTGGNIGKILRDRKKKRREANVGENELTDAGDDFLNYSFGWKPFLGDLSKMYDALKNLDKRLDYLERNQGKILKRHARVELEVDSDFSLPELIYTRDIGYFNLHFGVANSYGLEAKVFRKNSFDYKPRYHMTVHYRYTIPKSEWPRTRNRIRGFLDAFGVRFDPSIIWNAIPFSFVVDWVVDVGGFLREFAPNDLGMQIEIIDASHSLKWNYVGQISAKLPKYSGDPAAPLDSYVDLEVADVIKSYYERKRYIPFYSEVAVDAPNTMQWALGGALASSRNKGRFWRG